MNENEDQIRTFCREHPEFHVVAPQTVPEGAAVGEWGTLFLPHRTASDGFFTAILERV